MSHKDKLRQEHDERYPSAFPKPQPEVMPVPGAIVVSGAGRDRYREFIILEVKAPGPFEKSLRVTVADGSLRHVDSPKVKNLAHLILVGMSDEAEDLIACGKMTDKDAVRILKEFKSVSNKTI